MLENFIDLNRTQKFQQLKITNFDHLNNRKEKKKKIIVAYFSVKLDSHTYKAVSKGVANL